MAAGGPKPSAAYVERQLLTRLPATPATPSGNTSNATAFQTATAEGTPVAGDGLVLAGLFAIVVSVYPWAGQTLSGGSLLCWIYNPYQAYWTRCDDLDFDLTSASGFRAKTFPSLFNISRLGMLINWLASSVTVSVGTDVLVRVDGFTSVWERGT